MTAAVSASIMNENHQKTLAIIFSYTFRHSDTSFVQINNLIYVFNIIMSLMCTKKLMTLSFGNFCFNIRSLAMKPLLLVQPTIGNLLQFTELT